LVFLDVSGFMLTPTVRRTFAPRGRTPILRPLRRHIPGSMTIVRDRGNIHDRLQVVRAHLARHPEIVTERPPSYVPETNPDGMVRELTKHGRPANFTPEDTIELRSAMSGEFARLHGSPGLL
jgi:hypothetical protein